MQSYYGLRTIEGFYLKKEGVLGIESGTPFSLVWVGKALKGLTLADDLEIITFLEDRRHGTQHVENPWPLASTRRFSRKFHFVRLGVEVIRIKTSMSSISFRCINYHLTK